MDIISTKIQKWLTTRNGIMIASFVLSIYVIFYFFSNEGIVGILLLTPLIILSALTGWGYYTSAKLNTIYQNVDEDNALLSSIIHQGMSLYFITTKDEKIIQVSSKFRELIPNFSANDVQTVEELFRKAAVPNEFYKQLVKLLHENREDIWTLPLKDIANKVRIVTLCIEKLPSHPGLFLVREKEQIEDAILPSISSTQKPDAASKHTPLPQNAMATYLSNLSKGCFITDPEGNIIFANPLIASWLGYQPDEFTKLTLKNIIHWYPRYNAQRPLPQNFSGDIILLNKARAFVFSTIQQTLITQNDKTIGALAIITDPNTVKKAPLVKDESQVTDNASSASVSQFIAESPLAIARLDSNGIVIEINSSLQDLAKTKLSSSGWPFIDIVGNDYKKQVIAAIDTLFTDEKPEKKALPITLSSGDTVTASLYLNRTDPESNEIIAHLIDTTEQKNLEQRFAHSQKMQAVGQLAGGVAHDFNNLLTAMIGFCDLLLMRHPAGDQSFADIMQIKQNANRAANLVRQLLAFSRRQTLQPKILDLTDVLSELSNLIRRLIGENIELKVVHGRDLGRVKADQGQLEQVFINLAVNARDAMPNGGKLTIQTRQISISAKNPISRDLIPPLEDDAIAEGDYILVEVIDTGTGIPKDIMQKIFEPFFSTKEVGSGTGLGLATVYGIIKQTDGYIYVTSKESEGTTFSLFFKHYSSAEVQEIIAQNPEVAELPISDDLTGRGVVLLVEDEMPVRSFAARALRNKGYTVIEAESGEVALSIMEQKGDEVDIVVSDVIMPGINGPTMIEAVRKKFPRIKVIFISGYAADVFIKNADDTEKEFNFLAKPFTLKQLASKVKEVLQKA